MKFYKQVFLIFIILLIQLVPTDSRRNKFKSTKHKKTTTKNINTAFEYLKLAQLAYCYSHPNFTQPCHSCQIFNSDQFSKIHSKSFTRKTINFSMISTLDVAKNEIVIAFAGPKSSNLTELEYIQYIYNSGSSPVLDNKLTIENEFWDVYSEFRQDLKTVILNNKDKNIKLIGHAFGAVMALIGCYDMVFSEKIDIADRIHVVTYASLLIGDQQFYNIISQFVEPVNDPRDYYSFMPICVLSGNLFHCYKHAVSNNNAKYFKIALHQLGLNKLANYITQNSPPTSQAYSENRAEEEQQFNNQTGEQYYNQLKKMDDDQFGGENELRELEQELNNNDVNVDSNLAFIEKRNKLMTKELNNFNNVCQDVGTDYLICQLNNELHRVINSIDIENCA
jgi:hypothetical protein